MNFLILGDGAEEHDWAWAIRNEPEHELRAAYPGFDDLDDVPRPLDFEDALATAGVEAVLVGGDVDVRGEWLRRVAAAGLPAICLHPPGDDSEAYYQVALSHAETGAVLVPDLPERLHPGVARLRQALQTQELGAFRGIRYERTADPSEGDLARWVFPRAVDVVRALLGEIEAVTATGDPPGERPVDSLVVQLRGPESRRAEIRITAGASEPARLVVTGERGSLTLELDRSLSIPAQLVSRTPRGDTTVDEIAAWDPHSALLDILTRACRGERAHPDLQDGTRATELGEATVRSLRRGRTIDLHYEQISEAGNFKSVMTSTGCMLLMGILAVLPAALAGPVIGLDWTLYFAYAIPPVLVLFILLQSLRFAARDRPASPAEQDGDSAQ